VFAAAWSGWTIHFHTNGHNPKSWILAGLCGVAAATGTGGILSLHSGMVPGYLGSASRLQRLLARTVCGLYRRVICVSTAIRNAITGLGVPITKTALAEAYLEVRRTAASPPAEIDKWMHDHHPLLSVAMFFRPEYGLGILLPAIQELRRLHPLIGCIVMGDSEHVHVAESQVAAAGLERQILLAGDVEHNACVNIMACSDVFVRPTLEDGDSVSVREAIALGIPVVASRVGTRPAQAILFPARDAGALAIPIRLVLESGARKENYA
jgi:glycosyltransferase involved in cell wall biosynthesis